MLHTYIVMTQHDTFGRSCGTRLGGEGEGRGRGRGRGRDGREEGRGRGWEGRGGRLLVTACDLCCVTVSVLECHCSQCRRGRHTDLAAAWQGCHLLWRCQCLCPLPETPPTTEVEKEWVLSWSLHSLSPSLCTSYTSMQGTPPAPPLPRPPHTRCCSAD